MLVNVNCSMSRCLYSLTEWHRGHLSTLRYQKEEEKVWDQWKMSRLRRCSIFPLYSVTSVKTKQIKRSGRNGSTFTSWVVAEWGLRGGQRWSVGGKTCAACLLLSVYMSCQVVLMVCCERVLGCGLTFESDKTSDICSPLRRFTLFWRVSQNALTIYISASSLSSVSCTTIVKPVI